MSDSPERQAEEIDPAVVAARVARMNAIGGVLKKVMPDATEDLVGTVTHDLCDFLEIAENHQARMEKILTLKGVEDQRLLAELLEDLYYGDVKHHLSYHVESMDETLPRLIERLEGETN